MIRELSQVNTSKVFQTYEYEIYVWYIVWNYFVRTHPKELIVFLKKLPNFLKFWCMKRFHALWKKFSKTIYNVMNREKHFLTEGFLLDEFLHIPYESEVHHEKFFILLYVSQRHFKWCKVEHNETICFLYQYLDLIFFFFQN